VKNGVPYDVAFTLDDADRLAHLIVLGEHEGNRWNWRRMGWDEGR
jgi:hypothetical protein